MIIAFVSVNGWAPVPAATHPVSVMVFGAAPVSDGAGGCANATDEARSAIPLSSTRFMTVSFAGAGCKDTATR